MLNETVKEWIAKAEGDFSVACRERRVRKSPNWDAVCFHCQQCMEKYLKALLIHFGVTPPKTHDLLLLDGLLKPVCERWSWPEEELRLLTHASVVYRYPGETADQSEAIDAIKIAQNIRKKLLIIINSLEKE
jgi:HEPN domain-containing protein